MPVKKEDLRKNFGELYTEMIDDLNLILRNLGQEIICIDGNYSIQFDLKNAKNDQKLALLLMLYTDRSTFARNEETGDYIISPLTRPELAILAASMALWQKHGRSKTPLKELENATEGALGKKIFKRSFNTLIKLEYLKENEGIITPGWRFKAELEEPIL